jgi:exodeoxyribonuclease VII small subunit
MPKFEECLQRLEEIVEKLERGDLALEESLALFEEGMKLSNSCRSELEAAEGKVELLLKQNGKMQPEPFDALVPPGEKPTRKKSSASE